MRRPRLFFALSLAAANAVAAVAISEPARGDLFVLESGGQVEGEWLNREEQPLREYLVRTPAGLTISLPQDQVREAVRESPAATEYRRRAPAVADTTSAQWDLAEWCRKQGLTHERRTHLERIIQLDPNHQRARGALGYQYLQGQWVTRSEFRRREGYEYYQGRWRTPQEIEILEARGRTDLAQKDWAVKLRRWRKDLATAEKSAAAYDQIAAIKDPVAVSPLATAFKGDGDRRVKMLYADVLANINTGEAVGVLVDRTLSDPDEELFHYCLDKLVQLQPPHVADGFIAALKDKENARVNRAGAALGRLRDLSAISPLIDALITTHTSVLPGSPGASPNSTSTTFGEGGTVMKQNEGPRVQISHVQNQHVLDALTRLTGADFGFDKRAWRFWHAQEKQAAEARQPLIDARRQE
jgi:hypothetical protein